MTFDQICWRSLALETMSARFFRALQKNMRGGNESYREVKTEHFFCEVIFKWRNIFYRHMGFFCTLANCTKLLHWRMGWKIKNLRIYRKYRKKTGSHQSLLCSCSKRITQPVAFYITGVWLPSAVKHRVRCNKVGWWIAFLISLNPWKENWPGGWRFFLLAFNRVGIQSVWQANNDTVRPRRKEAGCQWSNPGGRLRGAGRLVSGWFRSPSWLRWQLRVQKAANRMRLRPRGHVAPARITSGQKKVKRLDSKQSLLF